VELATAAKSLGSSGYFDNYDIFSFKSGSPEECGGEVGVLRYRYHVTSLYP